MIKLNLGCGSVRPDTWVNTDSSLNANLQRLPLIGKPISKFLNLRDYKTDNLKYMNLNKKWTYLDNSVDIVYASHLFEHLTLKSADLFLKESFRTLKPNGILRIVVPDLHQIALRYINEYDDINFKDNTTEFIMWAINMHREGQYGNPGFLKRNIFEFQGYPHQHKYMYDDKSLSFLVEKYNFKDIKILEYGKSDYISDILLLEGGSESYLSVYLEARK